ncbi:hypothetical protein PVAG01_05863 [Phlyctema vagabunda]|uniref:Carrier domain-containing protein n=1 Tax=Phlyctema vagabunda TaxID=108571 RepID=A0ABR4PEF3_9HELO
MSLVVKTNDIAAPVPLKPFALLMGSFIEQSATICHVEKNQIIDAYPCTPLQEGLLALSDKQPGAYVSNFIFRLPVEVDIDQFKLAWSLAVETTPILRTRIVAIDNWPTLQVVTSEALQWRTGTSLQDYLVEAEGLAFKIGLPLSHYALIHEREERYFVFTAHHSIYDGWSLPLLFRKVENIYHQREPSLALSDGFSNFIQHITSVDEAQSRKFWGGLLAGAKQLNFPQYPNPEYTSIADESVTHSIKFGSPSSDFTTATILQGAWAILLGMHGESTDVTFGSVISGRNTTIPGISEVIGPTISTVPVRVLLERSQSIRDFLQHLQNQTLERIPFEQAGIQNITKLGPDALAACQFQSLLVIQPLDVQMATILGSERIESNDINARSIPLTMECNLGETRLEIIAHFDSNLIEKSKMDVIIHQFEHIFLELSSKQGKLIREIPLCGHYDKQLIRHWNKEIPAASKTCVHHLFKRQVVLQPDSPAVHAWDFKLNYSELDRYARKFAHYLVSLGVGPEVWVPVVMDKSAWTIVAMVAILKAGGACAALDPSHPSRRLSGIIQDLEARVLVVSPQYKNRFVDLSDYTVPVDKAFLDSLPAQTEDPETTVDHTNAAVAIFTSGSTGKPKGIVIEHAHLCTSSKAHGSAQGVGPGTRVFSFASYAFDVSLGDTWTTIMRGACICIPSEADRLNNLAQTITNMRANWLALTPTVSRLLTPNMIPTVKTLTLGGEAIGKDDVTTWADHLRVVGFYGPAETVIGAMMSDLSADRTLNPRTLGHGLNTNLWVVDPDDQDRLVPVGTIGELLIQGPAISRGYLNDLDRTAKSYLTTKPKFLTDAAFGVGHDQKIFKTGDLVYQTPRDGALVYVGRKDTQIKLHGQRIELQEIEEQLVLHSIGHLKSVAWAVELIQPAGPETCFLAAFFANNGTTGQQTNIQDIDIRPIPSELRELLLSVKKLIASHVPKYMVPAMFTPLTKMPMNTSGKTDRGQLRLLGKGLAVKTNSASYSLNEKSFKPKPRRISGNSKELRIKKLWSKCLCLPLDSISSTDDFFDLGGNSVTAMRLAASARAEGFALSVQDIFRNSSLADMSITAASVVKAGENSNVLEAVRRQVARFSHEAEDAARITDYQEWVISHGLTKHSGFYNDLFFEFDGAVDAGRLRDACVSLVHHNPIMRSAFVAHKGRLILVDRKESSLDIDFQQYTWSHETATAAPMLWEQQPLRLGKPPVKFALIKKSPTSHRLVLRISHAQYDGLTLPLLLEDLSAAYLGEALASRPSFFNFLRNNEEKDNTPHLHYWRELLENASLTQIVQHKSLLHRGTMDAYVQQAVRNPSLRSTGTTVTNATIFKAAWGLALSKLSGNEDVVFGHIIAGRNDSDHDYTSTFGACLNVTPVRVRTTPNQISSQLLSSIHTQAVASIPHEGVGFKSIFQACTSWQTWENFSSILQHQNLDSSKKPTSFGDSFCSFSGGVARVGAAVDVWIMTMPRGDETDVQLHYSSLIPRHVAQEMLELFCAATDALCDEGVRDVSIDRLISKKIDVKFPLVPQEESEQEMAKVTPVPQQESIESRRLHQIVDDVWRQVGCHDGSDMIPLDKSFLDLGGDLVAACLMANIYHGKKYQITVEDICNHLTVRSQRNFLMKQLVE